ncbi:MAG: heme-degrading monooxygenase HmoA [Gammaproteobacteria bacterium]|jgi:heme-degrading monooxygenase HmoA
MYARMLLVELKSVMKSTKIDLANRWHADVSTLPGFIRVNFLSDISDESIGEYGYISFWETLERAKYAGEKLLPNLVSAILKFTTQITSR